ncbi:MAG: hypothetical protein M1299_05940 [Firmicutes bacterium]|nr:hypothetical protein [Bacillota bacterium]MCL5039350.1 hypothetical protein [Bacillota bacterium]
MAGYKELIEAVLRREMGILGPEKTQAVAREAGLRTTDKGELVNYAVNKEDLGRLMEKFNEKYGLVTVIGCKVALMRMAREYKLELPAILQ